jgi:glycosyltransferase involved in cell wall biosynthesis
MKPKVFLEAERLRNYNSGLGQFCFQLTKELIKKDAFIWTLYLPKMQNVINIQHQNTIFTDKKHKIFPIRDEYDIWHCLHQDSDYLPKFQKSKLVLTIHDLNFLERNDFFSWKKKWKLYQLQQKINRASALVFISEYTANEVRIHLKIPNRILQRVIYNGNNVNHATLTNLSNDKHPRPFVFSIGLHPKKNYHVLLPLLANNPDLDWIIAGKDSKNYQSLIEKEATKLGIEKQLHFVGAISDDAKNSYYQNCKALWFPSLSEGFGLPIIEAMSFGKPVFCSNLTSLPEIGGDLAYYFENFEENHLFSVFKNGMIDFNQNPQKVELSKNHAAQFSWENAAKAYFEVYQNLMING